MAGAALGTLAGLFFGLPGLIIGPFAGAMIGKLASQCQLAGRRAGRSCGVDRISNRDAGKSRARVCHGRHFSHGVVCRNVRIMRRPKRGPLFAFTVALALVVTLVLLRAQVAPYDLVIRNARVVDGTGSPWFRADIGIRGDEIATIARRIDAPSTRTLDATGQVVAPGFIDIHVHAFGGAAQPSSPLPIVEVPTADNYVRQGVTTLITGPDGFSPVPLRPALELDGEDRNHAQPRHIHRAWFYSRRRIRQRQSGADRQRAGTHARAGARRHARWRLWLEHGTLLRTSHLQQDR